MSISDAAITRTSTMPASSKCGVCLNAQCIFVVPRFPSTQAWKRRMILSFQDTCAVRKMPISMHMCLKKGRVRLRMRRTLLQPTPSQSSTHPVLTTNRRVYAQVALIEDPRETCNRVPAGRASSAKVRRLPAAPGRRICDFAGAPSAWLSV